ncbi:hypothetical protein SLA2020_284840 [Shorea laevis]
MRHGLIWSLAKRPQQDFIMAIHDLKSLLTDVDALKTTLFDSNSKLNSSSAHPLLPRRRHRFGECRSRASVAHHGYSLDRGLCPIQPPPVQQ